MDAITGSIFVLGYVLAVGVLLAVLVGRMNEGRSDG